MPRLYLDTVKRPSRNDLIAIIRACLNPKRSGGVRRVGWACAFGIFEKRARAQAEHDHYQSCEAEARRVRFAQLGWPLVGDAEQARRAEKRAKTRPPIHRLRRQDKSLTN